MADLPKKSQEIGEDLIEARIRQKLNRKGEIDRYGERSLKG